MQYAWTCSCCGKQFSELCLDWHIDAPIYWHSLAPEERDRQGRLSADFCTINDDNFVRGCLEIPIVDLEGGKLVYGVWVSLSADSMRRARELFDRDAAQYEPTRFGWLSNRITIYPDTLNLKTDVRFRTAGLRPLIEMQPNEHPLAVEQRRGITLARAEEIATALMPRH